MALTEAQAISTLTVLTRLAQREQDTEAWIRRAIQADPDRMLGPAIQVAIETGDPMPSVLVQVLGEADLDRETLQALRGRIPPHTALLRDVHALIAEKLMALPDAERAEESATVLHEYAERLLESGDAERGLPLAAQAVEVAERDAEDEPADLLEPLRVLSACQVATGSADQAVATAERGLLVLDELNRRGRLLPTHAARVWGTLGLRCLSAGDPERAVEQLYLAVAVCSTFLQGAQDDVAPAAPPVLLRTETPESFEQRDPSTDRMYFAVPERAHGVLVASVHQLLATNASALVHALMDAGRPEEALPHAVHAVSLSRELAAESPDAFAVAFANAVYSAQLCVRACPPSAERDQVAESLAPDLHAAISTLIGEASRRQDLGWLSQLLSELAGILAGLEVNARTEAIDDLIGAGLEHLRAGRVVVSLVVLRGATDLAREASEHSAHAQAALSRALSARARVEEVAGLDTAMATAEEALAASPEPESSPMGRDFAYRQRASLAHQLANRLVKVGRVDDALRAEQESVTAMATVWDVDNPDDVWFVAAGLAELLTRAEELGRLTEVDDDTLELAAVLVECFEGHRDADRVLDFLATDGFMALTALARRDDPERVARVHRAVIRVAREHPEHRGMLSGRTLVVLNAIGCHLRTHRLDLAEEALADLIEVVADHPEDAEPTVQLAMCANQLVNVYIDLDVQQAADVIRRAGHALRSAAYQEALPGLGEDDPPGYLLWLDQILASAESSTPASPPRPDDVRAAVEDYVATLAQRSHDLGDTHPLTIATRQRLAAYLDLADDHEAAEEQLRIVYESAAALHGQNHPDTVAAQETWAGYHAARTPPVEAGVIGAVVTGAVAGTAMGYVLQRGQLCFHAAIDGGLGGRWVLVRGWALGVALASVGLALLYALPGTEHLNQGLAFRPVADVTGGLVIGAGMVVAQSCISGLFYKLGSGMLGALAGLAGWAAGELLVRHVVLPGPTVLAGGEGATVPGLLGLPRMLVAAVVLAAVCLWLWGRPGATGAERSWQWGWRGTGLGLGVAITLGWALAAVGGHGFGPSSVGAVNSIASGAPDYWLIAFLAGLVAGSAVAARTAGGYWLRGERPVRYLQLAAGGVLLGAGGWIAGGCNIGHGLSGMAQLNVSSVVVVAAMVAGVAATRGVTRRAGRRLGRPPGWRGPTGSHAGSR